MGAPQAAGQGPLRGSRPGALFRCPITPEEYDCERVDIDGEGGWKMTLHQGLEQPHQRRSEWVYRWAYFHVYTFHLSESEQREQTQPVAGSYCQESGDRREGGGKRPTPT